MALGRNILRSERRRRSRTPLKGGVVLGWTDDRGRDNYGSGRCVDISEHGCCIELTDLIPPRTIVAVRFPDLNVSAFASVRHVTRKGMKFHVGLEFGQPVRLQLTDDELVEVLQS